MAEGVALGEASAAGSGVKRDGLSEMEKQAGAGVVWKVRVAGRGLKTHLKNSE